MVSNMCTAIDVSIIIMKGTFWTLSFGS